LDNYTFKISSASAWGGTGNANTCKTTRVRNWSICRCGPVGRRDALNEASGTSAVESPRGAIAKAKVELVRIFYESHGPMNTKNGTIAPDLPHRRIPRNEPWIQRVPSPAEKPPFAEILWREPRKGRDARGITFDSVPRGPA